MNTFAIGDRIRILRVPDQVTRDRDKFSETYGLLNLAIGKSYSIRSFNNYDMAEIWLNDDSSEDMRGINHSIWIEREYFEKASD
jgi:hypothetical protein